MARAVAEDVPGVREWLPGLIGAAVVAAWLLKACEFDRL
jgi:hypothetical protein